MKDFKKASAVATVVTALTVTATSVVAEGGFVGLGITAAPDY